MRHHYEWSRTCSWLFLSLLGCSGSDGPGGPRGDAGPNGQHAVVRTTAEVDGTSCPSGGRRVWYGVDANANGRLDDAEIKGYQDVCHGADGRQGITPPDAMDGRDGLDGLNGRSMVVAVSAEPAGRNCEVGGQLVEIGADLDEDGLIDEDVVRERHYVCDGIPGENGAPGRVGLTVSRDEPVGENCEFGGQFVEYGQDADGNGSLDESEVVEARHVCRGAPGPAGASPLFAVAPEPPGARCAAGGERIDLGLDLDRDQVLESTEISETHYVCMRVPGAPAALSLVNVVTEPVGERCRAGGRRLEIGLDLDASGSLEVSEVRQTQYVCTGATGQAGTAGTNASVPWVVTEPEPAGERCTWGGQRIQVGLDADRNGTLATGEVAETEYVCNGAPGAAGRAGAPASLTLVSTSPEPAGSNCVTGGQRIQSGPDLDQDGVLQAAEVTGTEFVCNGASGSSGTEGSHGWLSLTQAVAEPPGANCIAGGSAVRFGLDLDGDQILDENEVNGARYVCNGAAGTNGGVGAAGSDGRRALVSSVSEAAGANCSAGGSRFSYGVDDNADGVLAPAEIDATRYVCNGAAGEMGTNGVSGAPGLLGLVRVTSELSGSNCIGGGSRIDTGSDLNANGQLELPEIRSTSFVCHEAPS